MVRTLNSPIGDQRAEFAYLYEIHHSGGGSPLRLTNASADVTALTFTWTAVGGRLVHAGAPDTTDQRGQGTDLELYGLDQTIIQQIQNNQFRGQLLRIYLLHWDPDTRVQDTPDLIFLGRQNSDYQITEDRDPDSEGSGGTVTVRTRITADLASVNAKVSTRTNVSSHQEMLRRSGQATPTDTFFERVKAIAGKDIYWGGGAPETGRWVGPTEGGGRGEDDDGEDIWW